MRSGFVLAVAGYFALVLGIGLRLPRKLRGLEAFFLASRDLGAPRVAFTLAASWIGAASLLVSTDEAWRRGVSAFWIIGLPAVITLLALLPLARPIRSTGGRTLAEIMEDRYGRAARPITTFLIVWYLMLLAASQMAAAGNFLKAFLGTSYLAGLAAASAVVLVTLAAGGFGAVVRTQTLQFFLLVAGIAGLVASLAGRVPWASVRTLAASARDPGYFDLFRDAGRNGLIALSFVLAWTVSPIAWQRVQAARNERGARGGLAAAAVVLAVFYACIVAAGMLFLPLFPGRGAPSPLVSEYIRTLSGTFLGGLVFVTVLAAILSTMAAAVNAGAFSLGKDLAPVFRRGGGSRSALAGPLATVVVGLGAFLAATRFQDILATLGLSSKVMAEGLFVPGLAALLLKGRAPLAGLLSLGAGGGYALLCFFAEAGLIGLPIPPWPRSLPLGLGLSVAGFALGSLASRLRRPARLPEDRPGAA